MKCDENIFKFCTADNWLNFHLFVLLFYLTWWNNALFTGQSDNHQEMKWWNQKQEGNRKLWVVKKILNDLAALCTGVLDEWNCDVAPGEPTAAAQRDLIWPGQTTRGMEQDKTPTMFTCTKSLSVGNCYTKYPWDFVSLLANKQNNSAHLCLPAEEFTHEKGKEKCRLPACP